MTKQPIPVISSLAAEPVAKQLTYLKVSLYASGMGACEIDYAMHAVHTLCAPYRSMHTCIHIYIYIYIHT